MNFQLDHLDAALLEEVITKVSSFLFCVHAYVSVWANGLFPPPTDMQLDERVHQKQPEYLCPIRGTLYLGSSWKWTINQGSSPRMVWYSNSGWNTLRDSDKNTHHKGSVNFKISLSSSILEGETYYESIPEFLKKTRITCEELMLLGVPGWDSEVCGKLLNVLKPATVALNSQPPNSTRYEALLHSMIPVL